MSSSVSSWLAYSFLKRQVRLSGIPVSKNFPQFVVIHRVQGFSIVKSRSRCFSEIPLLSLWSNKCQLISGLSAFLKPTLYIWKYLVQVVLKPSLKNFEHYLSSMWNECKCMVVWTFFGIALLWNWNENWHFSSPVATAEISKFAGILSATLSQHHLPGFEIAQLEFHHLN